MKTLMIGMGLWLTPACLLGQFTEIDEVPVEDLDAAAISDFLSADGDWSEAVRRSTCLTSHQEELVLEFISNHDLISPFELQVISDVPLENLKCLIGHMSSSQRALPSPGYRKSHIEMFTSIGLNTLKTATIHEPYFLLRSKIKFGPSAAFGITFEKDSRELFWNDHSGPSFLSVFIEKRFQHPNLKRLIIGDYRVQLGQGLLFNNFYRKGLAFNDLSIPKHGPSEIKPYTSIDENAALRGMAVKMNIGPKHAMISYVSFRELDGSIKKDSITADSIINLTTSGLHVSESQMQSKNAIKVASGGSSFTHKQASLTLSGQFHFDYLWLPVSDDKPLYKSHRTNKTLQISQSVSWDYRFHSINLYGELAHRSSEGLSTIIGLLWSPNQDHRFSLVYRLVPPNSFLKPRTTFVHSQSGNESGLFLGYNYRWNHLYTLSLNYDSSINPWWSYQYNPFKLTHRISSTLVKKRRKHYEIRTALHLLFRDTRSSVTHSYNEGKVRLMVHYMNVVSKGVEWRSRAQMTIYHLKTSVTYGWMFYQEIKAKKVGSNFSYNVRISRYFTQDYENRHYVYESRPAGLFSFPGLSGNGFKLSALVRFRLDKLTFSLFGSYVQASPTVGDFGIAFKQNFQ